MSRATLPLTAVLLWIGSFPILAGDKSKAPAPKSAPVIATLESLKKGWVQLTVTNTSDKTIRFIDVREGSAACYQCWRVEAVVDGNKKLPPAISIYSPGDVPFEVTLQPGQKHVRKFQLVAYVQWHSKEAKQANVVVHYEVEPAYFKRATNAPYLRFSSKPLKMKVGT
jgi:hypothetical protein